MSIVLCKDFDLYTIPIIRVNAITNEQVTWDLVVSLNKENYPVQVNYIGDGVYNVCMV